MCQYGVIEALLNTLNNHVFFITYFSITALNPLHNALLGSLLLIGPELEDIPGYLASLSRPPRPLPLPVHRRGGRGAGERGSRGDGEMEGNVKNQSSAIIHDSSSSLHFSSHVFFSSLFFASSSLHFSSPLRRRTSTPLPSSRRRASFTLF